jgi:hypothetical protein
VGNIVFVLVDGFGRETTNVCSPGFVTKNLIEYVPIRKGSFWVNIFDNVGPHIFMSRQAADRSATGVSWGRIACVEVPWVEGQGLDCPNGFASSMCTCTKDEFCSKHHIDG